MNVKNLVTVAILIAANLAAFFWGGYHTLKPWMFIGGLCLASAVCVWSALKMESKDLLALSAVTLITALVDEYAHTSLGIFSYFDGGVPSPLTVFGWSLFILNILTFAQLVYGKIPLGNTWGEGLRILPALASISLLVSAVWIQGYLHLFRFLLIGVYLMMGAGSVLYTRDRPLRWSLSIMATSLIIGASMEFLGGEEGLWHFHFNEPIAFFMAFTWALRTWFILAVCSLSNVNLEPSGNSSIDR